MALVVDDPSRWTPIIEALPIVLGRLHDAGILNDHVDVCVGVGRHHAVDDEAMRRRLGDAIVQAYRCHSPPVDDMSAYDDLGTTTEGVPVRVYKPVARADLRILIGSVLPHLQAGFGGGYKLIFPGTSHRSTLAALHRGGLVSSSTDPRKLLGQPARENPMRKAICSAAALLVGLSLSISHVLGRPGEVFQVLCGDPLRVQDELASEVERRYCSPESAPADVVIVGNDPWPGDPMQSFKVLLQHRSAGKPGGASVGFFWTQESEVDRSFPLPAMRAIASTGAIGGAVLRSGLAAADGVASALGLNSAFLVRWARELVVDRRVMVYAPILRERLGPTLGPIQLFSDRAPLWSAVERALGNRTPTSRVFPQGGLTYCPSRD